MELIKLLTKPRTLFENTIDEKVFLKRQGLFAFKGERGQNMFVRHGKQRWDLCRPALSDFFGLFLIIVSISHRKDYM